MASNDWNDQAVIAALRKAAMVGIIEGTELVRNEMIRLMMQSPHTGRFYRRRGVTHQASAPGEPPAVDRGFLVNSISTSYDTVQLAGRINVSAPYFLALELGTENIEPRPVARPALVNKRAEVLAAVQRNMAGVLRR